MQSSGGAAAGGGKSKKARRRANKKAQALKKDDSEEDGEAVAEALELPIDSVVKVYATLVRHLVRPVFLCLVLTVVDVGVVCDAVDHRAARRRQRLGIRH